jgi:hypothetical protein
MNSLQKLQKILGLGRQNILGVNWRINGVLIQYFYPYQSSGMKIFGDSVKIYYYGRKKKISTDYFPCVNEACRDAIQKLKMFGHKL